jgi:serine/threonine protein kinase
MPAPVNNDAFLQLVRKAKVVDEQSLQDCLRQIRAKGAVPPSPGQLAGELIRGGVLSQFQAEQLLQGKWRGFSIGRYRVLEQLGSGGMGAVFLGEHAHMHRLVAIKVLPQNVAKNPSAVERFYREARAGGALDHPNVVRTYDVGSDQRLHFMAMEFVDGTSLQEIVKRHGPLSPTRAAHYVRQTAMGLQHAHEAGLVHRDIKPGNLLLDRSGTIKILDLGLARFLHDHTDNLTRKYEENVLGTADYFSPEQAIDSHNVDIRTDIYSLGCTCYFLLTGRAPFEQANMVQKLLFHQQKEPEPISTYRSDVPDGLLKVIQKMTAKDANQRYQTPAELAEALSPWCREPIAPPAEKEMPSFSPMIRRAIKTQSKDANTPRPGPQTPPAGPVVQSPASPRPRPVQPTAPLPTPPAGPRSGKVIAPAPANKPRTEVRPRPPAAPPKPSTGMKAKPKDDAESDEWKAWHPDPKLVAWLAAGAIGVGIVLLIIIWFITSNRNVEKPPDFVPAPSDSRK